MNQILIAGFFGAIMGLLISRKRGPGNIFRKIKETRGISIVFRCETCTICWISFFAFLARLNIGIIPNIGLIDIFMQMVAAGGVGLAIAGIAQSIVDYDE